MSLCHSSRKPDHEKPLYEHVFEQREQGCQHGARAGNRCRQTRSHENTRQASKAWTDVMFPFSAATRKKKSTRK